MLRWTEGPPSSKGKWLKFEGPEKNEKEVYKLPEYFKGDVLCFGSTPVEAVGSEGS